MEKCEECQEYRRDAYRRPDHGRVVCNGCDFIIIRNDSPTGLVPVIPLPNGYLDELSDSAEDILARIIASRL